MKGLVIALSSELLGSSQLRDILAITIQGVRGLGSALRVGEVVVGDVGQAELLADRTDPLDEVHLASTEKVHARGAWR
jgi:hypothetical protein